MVGDGRFGLHVRVPEGARGPGILLVHEIYGVGEYVLDVADALARDGYVVGVPELFWRVAPGWVGEHTEEGTAEGMRVAGRFDPAAGLDDLVASLNVLRGLPEVSGGVGTIGFCFGGTLAFLLAAREPLDAAISFYGSGVRANIGRIASVRGPLQFHFGGDDPYIPRDQVREVENAVAGHPGAEIHVQEDGGHAFHNHRSEMFHQPEPAARAWALTEAFLNKHLPVG